MGCSLCLASSIGGPDPDPHPSALRSLEPSALLDVLPCSEQCFPFCSCRVALGAPARCWRELLSSKTKPKPNNPYLARGLFLILGFTEIQRRWSRRGRAARGPKPSGRRVTLVLFLKKSVCAQSSSRAAVSSVFLAAGRIEQRLPGSRGGRAAPRGDPDPPPVSPLLQPFGVFVFFCLKPQLASLLGRCSAAALLCAACIPACCFGRAG